MTDTSSKYIPSTPAATAAIAQTRETGNEPPPKPTTVEYPGLNIDFQVDPRVKRAVFAQPYERSIEDPVYRPLKIFTLDPSVSRLEGAIALVNVPYEPLEPGPIGKVFRVEDYDQSQNCHYSQIDLNDAAILIGNGRNPSPSDWLFHQQMVYAICSNVYACFRTALGRKLAWAFDQAQLRIRPHACYDRNAYYHRDGCELCFGYYRADSKVAGSNLPGGFVFTCLSHDIVAHEVTHALLDGLRAHFAFPTSADVLAFHEAFADLVAVFLHFSYSEVLQTAIRKSRGELQNAGLLTEIARQFGYTTGLEKSLRCAVDVTDSSHSLKQYDPKVEAHELGSVLVSTVFEAFNTIFKRKTERYVRLATNGSGMLPLGEMSPDLQALLATEASKLASQFLSICIRAIDYCPPVDLEFGEFLRAVITADRDLVPDDPWGYREAWIDAFRRRCIYPSGVDNLSEDALLWRPPEQPFPVIESLNFAALKFKGDPGSPSGEEELQRQACALGQVVAQPDHMGLFGLARPDDPCLGQDTVELPCVQSIRSSRRIGPNGQVVFDLVAEVTQRRVVRHSSGNAQFYFYGGSTIILGPDGEIRYIISKSVVNEKRLQRQRDFLSTDKGHLWEIVNGMYTPKRQLFKLLHQNQSHTKLQSKI